MSAVLDPFGIVETGKDIITGKGAEEAAAKASEASIRGAEIAAGSQREALDYLKERERLPRGIGEAALTARAGEFGIQRGPGGEFGFEGSALERAEASPFYQRAQQLGEESVLKYGAATGGLRSGSTIENLARVNQESLYGAYQQQLQGLGSLTNQPTFAPQIAGFTAGIGETLGQGHIGAAQAYQQGQQNKYSNFIGLGTLATKAFTASDVRLKDRITWVDNINGHDIFVWFWNKLAEELNLFGAGTGVIAQNIEKYRPDVIGLEKGYKTVNYKKLGLKNG